MKLRITQLAQQHFKTLVAVAFPTEQLDDQGQTVLGKAEFVGHFRCVPVDEAEKHLEQLNALRGTDNALAAVKLSADQVGSFFIGFEAAPGKEMPFTDDSGQDLVNTPDNVKLLLNSKEVREAVQVAFHKARQADVIGKKLEAVAHWWAGGKRTNNSRVAEALIAAGAPAELVEKVACKQNETPDIQPANVITVRLFFAVCTQWEHAGMAAARTGLNYAAVEARARALPEYLGLSDELRCWVWDGLQRMELAALKVWQDAT